MPRQLRRLTRNICPGAARSQVPLGFWEEYHTWLDWSLCCYLLEYRTQTERLKRTMEIAVNSRTCTCHHWLMAGSILNKEQSPRQRLDVIITLLGCVELRTTPVTNNRLATPISASSIALQLHRDYCLD